MVINKKQNSKFNIKLVFVSIIALAFITSGYTVAASTVTASLNGSSTYADTSIKTAGTRNNGSISATNSGANTYTRGYAKKPVFLLPDTVVASTRTLYPGDSSYVTFTQVTADRYYGQIVGQTVGSRGTIKLTLN